MRRSKIVALVLCVFAVAYFVIQYARPISNAVIAHLFLPDLSDFEPYPEAPPMPPVVSTPMKDLLAEYEAFLAKEAPKVLDALQPGLTLEEIRRLEEEHQVKLTDDMRELYQWRNGTPTDVFEDAFPYMHFLPFEKGLERRAETARSREKADPVQREFQDALMSYTYPWIGVLLDPAGEGYFFDPEREAEAGSFFCMYTGTYVFYPSVRNYIAQVLADVRAGRIVNEEYGLAYTETKSFEEEEAIENRYGVTVP